MHCETIKLNGKTTVVGTFRDMADFARVRTTDKYAMARHLRPTDTRWYGGTLADFKERAAKGDRSYAKRSEKYVDEFANLAVVDAYTELEYNPVYGVLDYDAAMAGNPECMYGPAVIEDERAPVSIYVDNWVQNNIPASQVEMRGTAVLALARAVAVFRPVNVYLVGSGGYRPDRKSWIQIVPVPTNPMDLAIASWMLGSPMMTRIGQFGVMHAMMKNDAYCAIPTMYQGREWQRTQLGNWFAERQGLSHDTVFLPLMDTKTPWNTEAKSVEWIKSTLKGLLSENRGLTTVT